MTAMFWWGAVLAMAGTFFLWQEHRLLAASVIVPGKVIGSVEMTSKGQKYYAPRVAYETLEGRPAELTATIHSKGRAEIGTPVRVAYRNEGGEPGDAMIVSFARRFGFAWAALSAGLCLMFVATGFIHGHGWLKQLYPLRPPALQGPASADKP